jgi:hypothetical protein
MPLTDEATIRAEADQLLSLGLRQLLGEYGEVHVVGSYLLQLMVWRDLDIHIVRGPIDKATFFTLGGRLADLLAPHRMHYRDETVVGTSGLPKGMYWGIYLGDERDGAWKIDIWISDAAVFEATRSYCETIRSRLSEPSREAILRIKSGCWQHPDYRRRFSSADIYTAVLDHRVLGIDDFWEFLRQRHKAV